MRPTQRARELFLGWGGMRSTLHGSRGGREAPHWVWGHWEGPHGRDHHEPPCAIVCDCREACGGIPGRRVVVATWGQQLGRGLLRHLETITNHHVQWFVVSSKPGRWSWTPCGACRCGVAPHCGHAATPKSATKLGLFCLN